MLAEFFKAPLILKRLRATLAAPYLDEFTDSMKEQGYARSTVRLFLYGIEPLDGWMRQRSIEVTSLDLQTLGSYKAHLVSSGALRYLGRGRLKAAFIGVRHFASFLSSKGIVPTQAEPEPTAPTLLKEYCQWMTSHRGNRPATLTAYRRVITELIQRLGEAPEEYGASALRSFVLERAKRHGIATAAMTVTATRMFLRFLSANGGCRVGLESAIPAIAHARLASLPRYIGSDDVEALIGSCDGRTITALRDRAILLLLARLGLRSGDVANLTFRDIDWKEGTICVSGKGRRQVGLPLPQEAGEAIVAYLQRERPCVSLEQVFVKANAPYRSLTSELVSSIVRRAVERAGIKAPSRGGHLLRHSAATAMLREGATLHQIASVLRHASIETTFHYAKVDPDLLRMVAAPWPVACVTSTPDSAVILPEVRSLAQPWPEVASC